MKWKEILSAKNISESALPAKIRKSVVAYEELVSEKNDIENQLNSETNEDEKQNLQDELVSIKSDIDSIDEGLCIEIEKFAQKGAKTGGKSDEERAAFAQKMKDAKAAKKANSGAVVEPAPIVEPAPTPAPTPAPEPTPDPTPEPTLASSVEPNDDKKDKDKDKKDDGFGIGSVLLGIGLFALSLGAYNHFKNK